MNKNNLISYTWSQPYTGWKVPHPANVNTEMFRVEVVDNIVDAMKAYPDAESVLAKILSSK
jgi:hypothetical protein